MVHRRYTTNLDPEDIHLEVHVLGEFRLENVEATLLSSLRLELECVIVVGKLDTGCFGFLGRLIAKFSNSFVPIEIFTLLGMKVRDHKMRQSNIFGTF